MGLEGIDEYGQIKEIIYEETLFLRHYIGEIVDINDPIRKGRVKVAIAELGWDTPDLGLWCWPRQKHGMSIPLLGQYAEVYFINGDRTRPVYLYPATEIIDNIPLSYTGDVREHILFESPENKIDNIIFDSKQRLLTLLEGTESAVLGDALLSWITNFINNIFNFHTHSGVTTGGGTSGVPVSSGSVPTDILSTNIKVK